MHLECVLEGCGKLQPRPIHGGKQLSESQEKSRRDNATFDLFASFCLPISSKCFWNATNADWPSFSSYKLIKIKARSPLSVDQTACF